MTWQWTPYTLPLVAAALISLMAAVVVFWQRRQAERARRAERLLLDAFLSNTSDTLYFKDRQARLTRASRKMLDDLGLEESQVLGKTDVDLFGEAFGRQKLIEDQGVIETGRPIVGLIERRDLEGGGVNWTSTTKVPLRDADGQIVGLAGITREINDIMQARQALEESEHRYRQLFEAESDAVFMIENETGRILEANSAASAMYGYSRPELLAMTNADLSAEPEDTRRVTRSSPVVPDLIVSVPLRLHRKKDGTVFPVEITGRFFVWQGRPVHLAAIRDTTQRKLAEEALRQTELRLQTLVASAPIVLWALDRHGTFTLSAGKALEAIGLGPGEVEGRSVFNLYRDHPQILVDIRRALAGQALTVQHQVGEATFETRLTPTADRHGEVDGLIAVSVDITDRRRADEALREAYAIIRRSPAVAFLWQNAAGWPVEYVSDNVATVLGYSVDDLLSGRVPYGQIVHPDDLERVAREVATCGAEADRTEFVHEPYRIVRPDGRVRWVDDRTQIRRDDSGRITHFQGVVLDITERVEAEHALREREELFRLLFEHAPIGMAITDLEGRFTRVNPAWGTMLGYTSEELLERTYMDVSHPAELPANTALRDAAIRGDSPSFELEKRLVAKGGAVVDALLRATLVRDPQAQPLYFISQLVDITRRRQAEEQIQASLREKEVLLKEIHHRVKNNLQVVSSLLALQADSAADPQVGQMFQDSRSRIRAMSLVHERLYRSPDLAGIDAREYIRDLVAHLFGIYASPSPVIRANVRVDDLALGVDAAIPCGLLLTELVSNVLKHAYPPDWEREGRVDVELRAAGDGMLTLTVADDGVGLSAGLDLTHAHSLGLQLVQMLVKQIRGTMELDRTDGTTFRVTFPHADRPPPEAFGAAGWPPPAAGTGSTPADRPETGRLDSEVGP